MTYQNTHIVGIGGTLRTNSRSRYALERSLAAAAAKGAKTTLLDLNQLRLPMYDPNLELADYGENVAHFVETVASADGLVLSTGAYHGSMAGVTKNAIDFCEFLSDEENPYWHKKAVGLIAIAGGVNAAPNTITAMAHCVHALRGTPIPLYAAVKEGRKVFDRDGNIIDESWANRLDAVGIMVTELAWRLHIDIPTHVEP